MERDQLHGFLPLGRNQRHDRFQNRRSQGESKHRDEHDHQRGEFRMVKRKLCRFLQMGKRPEYDQQQAEQRAVYRFQLNEWNHFHHEFGTQLRTQHSVG